MMPILGGMPHNKDKYHYFLQSFGYLTQAAAIIRVNGGFGRVTIKSTAAFQPARLNIIYLSFIAQKLKIFFWGEQLSKIFWHGN